MEAFEKAETRHYELMGKLIDGENDREKERDKRTQILNGTCKNICEIDMVFLVANSILLKVYLVT